MRKAEKSFTTILSQKSEKFTEKDCSVRDTNDNVDQSIIMAISMPNKVLALF